jgi:hypothetical protein
MSLTVVLAVGLDSSTAGHSQNDLAVSGLYRRDGGVDGRGIPSLSEWPL